MLAQQSEQITLNPNHFEFHFQPEHIVLFQYSGTDAWTRNTWEYIRKNANDIKRIQYNTKNFLNYIIIDIDHNGLYKFNDLDLPLPNFVIKNKLKPGGHLIYVLDRTISHNYYKTLWTETYQYFNETLGGDLKAIGFIGKNPFNKRDFEYIEIYPYPHNIKNLHSFVPQNKINISLPEEKINHSLPEEKPKKNKKIDKAFIGRNVQIFNDLRIYAYHKIIDNLNDSDFRFNVMLKAKQLNQEYENPLSKNELNHICKSIIKYCLTNKKNIMDFKIKDTHKMKGLEGMELKDKQRASANYSSAIKAEKNILLIKKNIINLQETGQKINVANLVKITKLSKPTIIKYKYLFE